MTIRGQRSIYINLDLWNKAQAIHKKNLSKLIEQYIETLITFNIDITPDAQIEILEDKKIDFLTKIQTLKAEADTLNIQIKTLKEQQKNEVIDEKKNKIRLKMMELDALQSAGYTNGGY